MSGFAGLAGVQDEGEFDGSELEILVLSLGSCAWEDRRTFGLRLGTLDKKYRSELVWGVGMGCTGWVSRRACEGVGNGGYSFTSFPLKLSYQVLPVQP